MVEEKASTPQAAAPARARVGAPPIDRLFHLMFEAKASDLHLSVGMKPLVRKDGEIKVARDESAPAFDPESMWEMLDPIMPERNREEFERRHDTDFAYDIPGLARFRSNIFMDRKGPGAVFRVIPSKILTAEDLGLSPHILKLCHLNKGLVLVTGPTGSGKSTTLCAMVDYINRNRADHIITIEDPIEFVHENKTVPDEPARGARAHRRVQGRAPRRAARGSGHHPRRRDARPRDRRDRDRDRRNRPPCLRDAAHDDRGVDGRPRHRPVPDGSAGADPHHAVGIARRASSRRRSARRSAAAARPRSRC